MTRETLETLETFDSYNTEDLYVMEQEYRADEELRAELGQTKEQFELRRCIETTLRQQDKSETEIAESLRQTDRSFAITNRLDGEGLQTRSRKVLTKMTNIQTCWGGHLKDATCHYEWRVLVSGSGTFNWKETLKDLGFRWDGESWYRTMTPGVSIIDNQNEAREQLSRAIMAQYRQEQLDDAASDFGPAAE